MRCAQREYLVTIDAAIVSYLCSKMNGGRSGTKRAVRALYNMGDLCQVQDHRLSNLRVSTGACQSGKRSLNLLSQFNNWAMALATASMSLVRRPEMHKRPLRPR